MKVTIATLFGAAILSMSAVSGTAIAGGTSAHVPVVDNSVLEHRCKRGFRHNRAGKCVRRKGTRGSTASKPRGSAGPAPRGSN